MNENIQNSSTSTSDSAEKPDSGNLVQCTAGTTGETVSGDWDNSQRDKDNWEEFNRRMEESENAVELFRLKGCFSATETRDSVSGTDDRADRDLESEAACGSEGTAPAGTDDRADQDTESGVASGSEDSTHVPAEEFSESNIQKGEPYEQNAQKNEQWTETVNPATHIMGSDEPEPQNEPVPEKLSKFQSFQNRTIFILTTAFVSAVIVMLFIFLHNPTLLIGGQYIGNNLGSQGFNNRSSGPIGNAEEFTENGIREFSALPFNEHPAGSNTLEDTGMNRARLKPVQPVNPFDMPPFSDPKSSTPSFGNQLSGSEPTDSSEQVGNATPSEPDGSKFFHWDLAGASDLNPEAAQETIRQLSKSNSMLLDKISKLSIRDSEQSDRISKLSNEIGILKDIMNVVRDGEIAPVTHNSRTAPEDETVSAVKVRVVHISIDGRTAHLKSEDGFPADFASFPKNEEIAADKNRHGSTKEHDPDVGVKVRIQGVSINGLTALVASEYSIPGKAGNGSDLKIGDIAELRKYRDSLVLTVPQDRVSGSPN